MSASVVGGAKRRAWEDWLGNLGLALFVYSVVGAGCGVMSLLLLPQHLIRSQAGQYANLIFTPLAIGLIFSWLGRYREARGRDRVLARFSYGFIFTLVMVLVRFAFAR